MVPRAIGDGYGGVLEEEEGSRRVMSMSVVNESWVNADADADVLRNGSDGTRSRSACRLSPSTTVAFENCE